MAWRVLPSGELSVGRILRVIIIVVLRSSQDLPCQPAVASAGSLNYLVATHFRRRGQALLMSALVELATSRAV